jgi:hypothetical protein
MLTACGDMQVSEVVCGRPEWKHSIDSPAESNTYVRCTAGHHVAKPERMCKLSY